MEYRQTGRSNTVQSLAVRESRASILPPISSIAMTFDSFTGTKANTSDSLPSKTAPAMTVNEKSNLNGVWAPCLTPIKDDLSIDPARMRRHVTWLLANGCSGIALFGTTGEAASFSADERMQALDALIASGVPPDQLMIGNGFTSIADSCAVTRHAVQNGCKAVLMLPPFYYKDPTTEGIASAYRHVLDQVGSSDIQAVLYHFPKLSAVPITHDLIRTLLKTHGELIAGLKDSTGDWSSAQSFIREFPGLAIFPGTDTLLLSALNAGGAGTITASANINPAGIRRIYDLWCAGDEAGDAQSQADKIRNIIQDYPLSSALKAVVSHYWDDPSWGVVRPPLTSLPDKSRADLIERLERGGFNYPA